MTYPNGTTAFFPLDSCPVPVTPANYVIDSTIESNPRFIAAENGSIYEAGNACNCSPSSATMTNSTGLYDLLNFALYSSQRIYPCGSTGFWTYNELGVLEVVIPVSPSTGSLEPLEHTGSAGLCERLPLHDHHPRELEKGASEDY